VVFLKKPKKPGSAKEKQFRSILNYSQRISKQSRLEIRFIHYSQVDVAACDALLVDYTYY
jgi:hypothetical protein